MDFPSRTQFAWPTFLEDGTHTDEWCQNPNNVCILDFFRYFDTERFSKLNLYFIECSTSSIYVSNLRKFTKHKIFMDALTFSQSFLYLQNKFIFSHILRCFYRNLLLLIFFYYS